MDHFEPILDAAIAPRADAGDGRHRALLQRTGKLHAGRPLSISARAPELQRPLVATGFNSIGIQSSGGAGMVLAQWIKDGHPPMDLNDVDIRRIHPFQSVNAAICATAPSRALGLLYAMHWPYRQFETARGVRRSPFHDRLMAAGACMGEVAGWERPNWYRAARASSREYRLFLWPAELVPLCRSGSQGAVRDAVALFDQSSFAKFLVEGRDAVSGAEPHLGQ